MPIWSSCGPVLCRFLSLCEQYGLLSKDVKAAARLDGQEPLDQNTKRLHKVQRFKREREIKAKLANAQMKRMRIAQLEAEVAITNSSVICIVKGFVIMSSQMRSAFTQIARLADIRLEP